MKQLIEEQLSAFLDGELPAAEEELLLRRLEQDTDYRDKLLRYAAIGQLMRGETDVGRSAEMARRISEAVASEAGGADVPQVSQRRWGAFATAGLAAAAGLVVLSGLISLGTAPVQEPQFAAERVTPQIRTADFQSPVDAPIEPARLTSYLVAHGDYAGGLSRQVVSSHVVTGTPDFMLVSTRGDRVDE